MDERTNCLERAGHVLILCLWIEKRLVDLILLKNNPQYIDLINKSDFFPESYTKLRKDLWEKDFKEIKEVFIRSFVPSKDWVDRLEWIYHSRNLIGHGQVSLYREYLLYRPDTNRNPIEKLFKIFEIENRENGVGSGVILLRLSDDKIYAKILDVLTEFDEKYLRYEAEKLRINYEKIR